MLIGSLFAVAACDAGLPAKQGPRSSERVANGEVAIRDELASREEDTRRDDAINIAPMRRYAEKLVATSQARLAIEHCAMFTGSRRGRCVLSGSPEEIAKLTRGLQLRVHAPGVIFGDESCLAVVGFGKREETALVPSNGIQRFEPDGALPGNTNNVHLRRVYAAPESVCFELEYPYG
jgi:hypothetical protein